MRLLAFTKPFGPIDVAPLAEALASVGADGADLLVREGQTVAPADPGRIADVAAELKRRDLTLDVVTTDLLDAGPDAERIIAACAGSGVPLMRVGFYRYDPAIGYRRQVEEARAALGRLAGLAARHGVRLALQLHHGTIHPSASLALALAGDLPDVRFYADPGNQAKEGSEAWALNADLFGDRMACMGVKNAVWRAAADGWVCEWGPFTDGGVVPWPEIIPGLRARGYTGPLSLHVHYPAADPAAALRRDMDHLRGLLG
ncbi:Sugar phosphate isomerase/epimerase [Nonomuraea solani]|uniref:Sugar phosphate isomerase/epimerase n=1 Tax=Nonomuraea solani TaxID=1144553 RepID=A0A1H6EYZ9_9ACTN|nr:sugar phosphate isomerase/epimerase [Nonomuraea solani]SEH02593.1 Sugar phosphate isomerase/epimerase [Nonomuraea solani]